MANQLQLVDCGQPDRLLPVGQHEATHDEIQTLLVDAFPTSKTRANIFALWVAFGVQLRNIVPVAAEYIDGSFVTSRLDPHDVDVAYWIAAADLNALPAFQQRVLQQHLSLAKTAFKVDGYVVPECAPGAPEWADFQHQRSWTEDYWQKYKNPDKNIVAGVTKGYLKVMP